MLDSQFRPLRNCPSQALIPFERLLLPAVSVLSAMVKRIRTAYNTMEEGEDTSRSQAVCSCEDRVVVVEQSCAWPPDPLVYGTQFG